MGGVNKMGERKSIRLGISVQPEVLNVLQEDSKRYGLSISGYISQLIMQKNLELSALRVVSKLTDEQIADEVRKSFNADLRS
jgi:hypothetical protein